MQAPLQAGGVPLPSSHPGAGDVDPPLDQVAALRTVLPAAQPAALSAFAPPEEALAAWMTALSRQGLLVPSGRRDAWVVRRETLQRVAGGAAASGRVPGLSGVPGAGLVAEPGRIVQGAVVSAVVGATLSAAGRRPALSDRRPRSRQPR